MVQSLIGQGYTYIFGLAAVYAASKCPAAVWVGAVVHVAVFAEEAFAAEGFYIHGHSVTWFYCSDGCANLFHYSNHFVSNGNMILYYSLGLVAINETSFIYINNPYVQCLYSGCIVGVC